MTASLVRSLVLALTAPAAGAQVFVDGASQIPGGSQNQHYTEGVEFADVDGDGDFDVAFGNGGDLGNQQNRLWLNRGGLQGGAVGSFSDDTEGRLPAVADDSRDIEFADVDSDGAPDLFVSNTSTVSNQPSRWWRNAGSGFFVDETHLRWVGVGEPGSSVAGSLVLPAGGFVDWSLDGDFADLDEDGDLDLVHSSYGKSFNGRVPTRLFLNDGDGFFAEHNPGGHQLDGSDIPDGVPALWAEGLQEAGTTAVDGSAADVAVSARGIEVADLDGDLDLDLLLGSRSDTPRILSNRLAETGVLVFRDVTADALGFQPGNANYEQELADLDNDDDLDLYGVDWLHVGTFDYTDALSFNDGTGTFRQALGVPGSEQGEVDPDYVDYDADGDLDVLVAGFGNGSKLYRNDLSGGLVKLSNGQSGLGAFGQTIDLRVEDVDEDGDYDLLTGVSAFGANRLKLNATQAPDGHAPRVARVTAVQGHAATAAPDPVRCQVYDNVPLYLAWRNDVSVSVRVDGVSLARRAARPLGGQVFRAELPGNLVGSVEYEVLARDPYGNASVSPTQGYASTGPTGAVAGTGTPGTLGVPVLRSLTAPLAGAPLALVGEGVSPGVPLVLVFSLTPSAPVDLGDGFLLHVGLPFATAPLILLADGDGRALLEAKAPPSLAGATLYAQLFALDGAGGAGWASSPRLELDFP